MQFKFYLVDKIAVSMIQISDWFVHSIKLYYTSKIDHGMRFPIATKI